MTNPAPLPLHVLTGFLGSGKSTLLAKLLEHGRGGRLAALVDDFATLPVDPLLVERVEEDVWALPSGCLCCTLRGELYESVDRMAGLGAERIVLETSGLADPAAVLHALGADERLAARVRPASVVGVVDATRAEDLVATQPEVRRQLESVDRIVLTKTDLAPQRVEGVLTLLAELAPGCEVRTAIDGEVDPTWLLHAPPLSRLDDGDRAHRWLHASAHHEEDEATPRTHHLELDAPADVEALGLWLRLVTQLDGPRLLRVKMLAEDRASGAVFALQSAGRLVPPPRRLASRPEGLRGVRLALVERGMDPRALADLLDSLKSAAEGVGAQTKPDAG